MTDFSQIFQIEPADRSLREVGEGHINRTYLLQNEEDQSYILQEINTAVFPNVDGLMNNIRNVTGFLRKKIAERGGDPQRNTMTLIPTRDGKLYYKREDGTCWRLYTYVDHTITYQSFEDPAVFEKCGEAFGGFLADLAEYPADSLCEVIPHFHDTPARYGNLVKAIADDVKGRAGEVQAEIRFAEDRAGRYGMIMDALHNGSIPLRVTHNDTKINNILMDPDTGEGVCVIDLDTVMPGSCLFDYGDSIRFGAATAAEDAVDPDTMHISLPLFEAYTKGYLKGSRGCLTEQETAWLPVGAWMMTMECGMRFLSDYLAGDTYFRIAREKHNLDRARTQFALAADMERNWDEMNRIIKEGI